MLVFMPMSSGWIVPAAAIRPPGSAAGPAHEIGPSGAFG
jgi:hypothetical protein